MSLTDEEWRVLLRRIRADQCTPFLGSELSYSDDPAEAALPRRRSEIARALAAEYGYPLNDTDNLPRVTQFIATTFDPEEARFAVVSQMRKVPTPDFGVAGEPHAVLARLPLSVYVTTAYDDFLVEALKAARPIPRTPSRDYCRWDEDSVADRPPAPQEPDPGHPLVYHLHGYIEDPGSEERAPLVLTEDDYLDFLVNTSDVQTKADAQRDPLPPLVRAAFARPSLLFLGYRLTDLEFRALLRSIRRQLKKTQGTRYSIQLIQIDAEQTTAEAQGQMTRVREYLSDYCQKRWFNIQVRWMSVREFLQQLEERLARQP